MSLDWNQIVEELAPGLWRYFCASFPGPISEELVQTTLLRLFEKVTAETYDPAQGSLRMYAYGIARLVRLEQRRSPTPSSDDDSVKLLQISSSEPSAEQSLSEQGEIERLRRAIEKLPIVQKDILSLYLDDELTLEQMGQLLGLPTNTVKSHIHRAKENLAELLGKKKRG